MVFPSHRKVTSASLAYYNASNGACMINRQHSLAISLSVSVRPPFQPWYNSHCVLIMGVVFLVLRHELNFQNWILRVFVGIRLQWGIIRLQWGIIFKREMSSAVEPFDNRQVGSCSPNDTQQLPFFSSHEPRLQSTTFPL